MRLLLTLLFALLALAAAPAHANWCGTPGRDGDASISGVVNTYYAGTASVSAGATSIAIGPAAGLSRGIAAGDLLLVIQMQDATINTSNNAKYGDGNNGGFGSGYTNVGQSGRYEFVRATSNVGSGGGTVSVVSGSGGGLANSYVHTDPSASGYKRSFQVIRVPQYRDATVSGTVTAMAWNGSTGGVVVIDVARRLTFAGGTISASGRGFRGGAGRRLTGGSGSSGDYRTAASNNANASKGEGIVGTPRFVNDGGALLDIGVEGIPNGSYGRGAPGNAGGGGTDGNPGANNENTGGGGGGNAGAGGEGGHGWCSTAPNGCEQSGGHPGTEVSEIGVARVVMGGGGGAGTNNDGTGSAANGLSSSGAAGGGIVMVRAAEIAGSGTFAADGASGDSSVGNDSSGGGGAGGSILVSALRIVAGSSLGASARGGDGGSNSGGGAAHGPGGGGGGGFVAATFSLSANVSGGSPGTTANGGAYGASYGAAAGAGGAGTAITGASIPGLSSGGECTPTVTKSFATSPVAIGGTSRMTITVTNHNPTTNLTALAFTDTYPAGLVNAASPAAARSCGTGTLAAAANGGSFAVSAATVAAGASCSYAVTTRAATGGDKTNILAAGAVSGNFGSYSVASLDAASAILQVSLPLTIAKASSAYLDPVNGTSGPKMIPGGFVAYTITVANPGSVPVDSDSILVVDATPAGLQLFVGDAPGGTGPVLFRDGSPASALTFSYQSLASASDDVEFSNNGGASWGYVPVPNTNGVDPAVTHMRIRPKGSMAGGASFQLIFGYRIG